MATLHLSTTARNAADNAVANLFNAGAGAGTIKVYSGSMPADPQTAATGTLLATFTLSNPAFGTSANGTATLNAVASVTAAATGTAGWFRAADGSGNAIYDGDVATSGATLNLDTVSITSGGTVSITSGTETEPGA